MKLFSPYCGNGVNVVDQLGAPPRLLRIADDHRPLVDAVANAG